MLRCGKPKPDGSICGVLLRTNTYYRSNTHLYTCPGKTQGGCGGVARHGPHTDEYVTEALLAKLDERQAAAPESAPWPGAPELERAAEAWHADSPTEDGGLDLSEKRSYVREALHAVIVSPAGKGAGSHGKFNPDLLQLVWRT